VLIETAQEVENFALQQGEMLDNSLVEKMEAEGMQVNKANQKAFVAGSDVIYAKFADEVEGGQKMLDKVSQLRTQ
jgi:TRAP-type C4-dicarboxylate transport system substrate-binding protein